MSESSGKLVGPIMRGMDGELADAVIAAVERDNPDREVFVDDQGGYIRISTEHRCVLTRSTLEDELGRPFPLSGLETQLASFAGRVITKDDEVVWFLDRED